MNEEIQMELSAAKKRRLNNGGGSCSSSTDINEPSCSYTTAINNSEPSCSLTADTDTYIDNEDKYAGEDSYGNYVNPEEVKRLKEFQVLDEVKSNDEDSNKEDSDSSEGIPEEEIERMLDEDLPDEFKGAPKLKEKTYIRKEAIVLEEKGVNHFELLPLDWIAVRHTSGMPIYMHRTSRVCTLSKPYFLGKGNIRRHDIPISAIPCFVYRRALEEEKKQEEIDKRIAEQIRSGNWVINSDSEVKCEQNSQDSSDVASDTRETLDQMLMKQEVSEDQENICPFRNGKIRDNSEKPVVNNSGHEETNGERFEEESAVVKSEDEDREPAEATSGEVTAGTSEADNKETQCNGDEDHNLTRQPVVLPGGIIMPPPRVETVSTSWRMQHLTAEQINEYCSRLFKFKTVNIMHFKRWADRRKYTKARKTLQYPPLPRGTKLITIPAQPSAPGDNNAAGKTTKRDWVMNMHERSCYLSVFHEYVRRALQKQPIYQFKELDNPTTPYQATVFIGGMQYGVGYGTSKRQAKAAAARSSIHILIPEMKDELDEHAPSDPNDPNDEPEINFFDLVAIEDTRITEFCSSTCEPSPHAILRTCLLRNFGAGDRHIHTETKKLEHQKIEMTMKVGKHSATVVSKNKKTAKQLASQAILQAIHPHIRSWGSLLRLYGSRSVMSCKEKKREEQKITLLQDKARQNEPNYAVLEKLRNEMRKLRERDEAVVPIGTFLLQEELPTHSGSNLNNVEL